MNNVIKRVWNQNKMVQIEDLQGMTFQAETAGHTFEITGIDDAGEALTLTGTPAGVFLRPDNTDVALTCSVTGGKVYATLPGNCYDVPGRFAITIFLTSDSQKTALYAGIGTVSRTSSGTAAPGTTQSVVDLINAINAAVNSIPANYSSLLADIAPTYSNSALYSVGQYAWYDGDLKRCIVPITTAESYTAAHWTSAVLGQDVSDLKSALKHDATYENMHTVYAESKKYSIVDGNVFDKSFLTPSGGITSEGEIASGTAYPYTDYIPVNAGDIVRTSTRNRYIGFYNSSLEYLHQSVGEETVSAPTNTAYMRIFAPVASVGSFMAYINQEMPSTYYPFGDGPYVKDKSLDNTIEQIATTTKGEVSTGYKLLLPDEKKQGAYLDQNNTVVKDSSLTNFYIKIYRAKSGDEIKLIGKSASLNAAFPFAIFVTDLSATGTLIANGSAEVTDYNVSYTAPNDGYVVVAGVNSKNSLNAYISTNIVEYSSTQMAKDKADLTQVRGGDIFIATNNDVSVNQTYIGYYIDGNGVIQNMGSSATNWIVEEYYVEHDKTYMLTGYAKLGGDFPFAGFKKSSGTSGTMSIVLQGSGSYKNYNASYTAAYDGYLFVAHHVDWGSLAVTYAEKSCETVEAIKKVKKAELNPWYGKKVVWLGTSVSFGQNSTKSYAQEIADYLGFNLVNCSVPGLGIHTKADGSMLDYGSLCLSIEEYAENGVTIASNPVTPYVPGGSYNNYYDTWENVFTEANADADLFVFDVAPNNTRFQLTDWNAFNYDNWAYNDSSSFSEHRTTFLGALLFLMDKMYTLNPNARMIFVLGSWFCYADGKTAFETIGNKYHIGLIDLWGKINITPPSLEKIKSRDGTDWHPSTFAHEMMGRMLAGEFNRFS